MSLTMLSRRDLLLGRSKGQPISDLPEDEEGATAMEYGLIGAVIAVALIPAVARLGRRTRRPLNCVKRTQRRARRGRAPNCGT